MPHVPRCFSLLCSTIHSVPRSFCCCFLNLFWVCCFLSLGPLSSSRLPASHTPVFCWSSCFQSCLSLPCLFYTLQPEWSFKNTNKIVVFLLEWLFNSFPLPLVGKLELPTSHSTGPLWFGHGHIPCTPFPHTVFQFLECETCSLFPSGFSDCLYSASHLTPTTVT